MSEPVPIYINDELGKLYYNTDHRMWVIENINDPGFILYTGPGDCNKVVGTYYDFNAGDGNSPLVTEYSGGSNVELPEDYLTVNGTEIY
jgi:hypothetical protein